MLMQNKPQMGDFTADSDVTQKLIIQSAIMQQIQFMPISLEYTEI